MPSLPEHDQKTLSQLVGKQPGGMGGNVACGASRLGLRTGMVSWVGDDADGQLVLDDLRRFGVDTSHVKVESDTTTNFATVLIDPTGEKAIVVVPTAFNTLVLDPPLTEYLQNTRLVYCAAYDPAQLAQVTEIGRASGALICTDIEPAAGLQDETFSQVLSLVDIAFIDAKTVATDDYDQLAQELRAVGPRVVIMSFGAEGALACDAQGVTHCPAFTVPVVDTTGAGDCFAAAFLTAYLHHSPLDQALRYASAAAALSIQEYGARGALPTDEEVQACLTNQQEQT